VELCYRGLVTRFKWVAVAKSEVMRKFKIKVARIETTGRGGQHEMVRVAFQVDYGQISLQIPVLLSIRDFDDTEMLQVARNALHRTFAELASKSQKWKLTANDLKQLSKMSLRPTPPAVRQSQRRRPR
jgi:hypothetical protein